MVAVPRDQVGRTATRRVMIRSRPQVKALRMSGQAKCDICLGMMKDGMPGVACECGKHFHNSCAIRVAQCPVCGNELASARQKPHVVSSEIPPVRSFPLSKEDKLLLLEERFLLGDITENTYLSMREQVMTSPDVSTFCSVCGRRIVGPGPCDCVVQERTVQCPECGEVINEEEEFCSRCGVVFSPDFAHDLFQCPECGRVVSDGQSGCTCGALLVGEGNMICQGCGSEVPEVSMACPECGRQLVENITVCPACDRHVDEDAFACLCGVVFSDRVSGAQCSLCGSSVTIEDKFCPRCGGRFADEPRLGGKVERKIKV